MRKDIFETFEHRATGLTVLAVAAVLVVGTISATSLLDPESSEDLVAEYRFDTGAGNTAYDTANGNNANFNGGNWTEGFKGKALEFDGSNHEYVRSDSSVEVASEGTLEGWIKGKASDQVSENIYPFGLRQVTVLGPSSSGGGRSGLIVRKDGSNYYWNWGDQNIYDGKWRHYVVTWDSQNVELYIDGVQIGSPKATNNDIPVGDQRKLIAGEAWNPGGYGPHTGKIDTFRYYSDNLTGSEIKSLYSEGSWRISSEKDADNSKIMDIGFQHKNSTHVLDVSGKNNHGTPENGVSQEPALNCKVGRCYSFDGSDDYLSSNHQVSDFGIGGSNSKTIMAYAKVENFDQGGIWQIGATEDGKEFSMRTLSSKNNFRAQLWSGSFDIDFSCQPIREWHHLAISYNGTNTKVYCNGLEKANQLQSLNTTDGVPFRIGRWESNYLDGSIDQVKVFNRSLSQQEIIENTEGLSSNGAVLDMRFNAGAGDHVEDYSGNENHGSFQPNAVDGPNWTSGVNGKALSFDGADDAVDLNSENNMALDTTEGFTLSAWIKRGSFSGRDEMIMDHRGTDNIRFQIRGDGDVGMTYYSNSDDDWTSTYILDTGIDDGEWHKVIWRVREDTLEAYIDGKKYGEKSLTYSLPNVDGNVELGPGTGSAEHYSGSLDALKLYKYALSPSAIKQNAAKPLTAGKNEISLNQGSVLSQTFDRIETCGQSDTVSCPSGMSGKVAVDESGEANHGDLVNAPAEKGADSCKVGSCLGFDGTDDYVETSDSNSLDLEKGLTVSFWARNGESSQNLLPVGKDNAYRFWFSSGNWYFRVNNETGGRLSSGYTDVKTELGEWDHVVGRFEPSNNEVSVWVNGKKAKSTQDSSFGSNIQTNTASFYVGGGLSGWGDEEFEGSFDQVKIYNRSLTQEDIWNLYTNGRDKEKGMAGSVAHWRVDKESSSLHDIAGNNDGEIGLLGESGTFNTSNGEWKEIRFQRSYENPVVLGTTNTQNGEPGLVFETKNVRSHKAHMRVCESEGSSGPGCDAHGTERAGYIVVDSGSMDNIQGIEAGSFSIDSDIDSKTKSVSYSESFSNRPMVFFTVQTKNGYGPVEAWPTSTGTSGFTAGICEQETNNACDSGHPEETVGWLAIEPGNEPFEQQAEADNLTNSVGASNWATADYADFSNRPVGLFEVQDNSGGQDPKIDEIRNLDTTSMEIRFCELDGSDSCDGHANMEYSYFAAEEGLLTYSNSSLPSYVDTEKGKALDFDGSGERVSTGFSESLQDGSFSVSFWMKADGTPSGGRRLVYKDEGGGGWSVSYGDPGSGRLRFYIRNLDTTSLDTASVIEADRWYHITAVRDAEKNNRYIYVNGVKEASLSSDSGSVSSSNDEIILAAQNDGTKAFDGTMDDIRVYPYALNREQVTQVMNNGGVSVNG